MTVRIIGLLTLAMLGTVRAAGPWAAATQPALTPLPDSVVRLWPSDPPATQAYDADDTLIPRGQPGNITYTARDFKWPSLAVYLPTGTAPTPAVIICPGGGYSVEAVMHEGVQVAKKFDEKGVAAFVLKYRLPDGHPPADGQLPVSQQDVLRAIQLVRSDAEKFHVDPHRVGVVGFSAGGHLAATAATFYDQANTFADKAGDDAASKVSARPDFAVLMYPVITMKAATHGGSRKQLLGDTPDDALESRFSADEHVTPQTPPLIIFHCEDDKTVPVANAHLMADAAEKAGVPHKLVIFSKGGHGFGLGNNDEDRTWFATCIDWLRSQHVLDATP